MGYIVIEFEYRMIFRYGHINEYGDAHHGYGYNHPYKSLYGPVKYGHGQHHGVIAAGPKGHPGPGPFPHAGPKGFGGPHLGVGGPHPSKPFHGSGHHASVYGAHLGSHQAYGFGSGSF